MAKEQYILYVDDTGFNASGKQSKVLQSEVVTYAGVLVNKKLEPHLTKIMLQLGNLLTERYGASEFHFTDIYNRRKPFENIQFNETLDMLEMFAELFNQLDLKVFVHTVNNTSNLNQQFLNEQINALAPYLHLPQEPKTQALMLVYLKAKKYAEQNLKNANISQIICDEGLRKNGAEELIKHVNVKLNFKSSAECNILQIADYAAWYLTRAKHILDKASTNKILSEADSAVLQIYNKLSNNYVGLSKTKIDLNNLQDFNYDTIYSQQKDKE